MTFVFASRLEGLRHARSAVLLARHTVTGHFNLHSSEFPNQMQPKGIYLFGADLYIHGKVLALPRPAGPSYDCH
jgi:hypothetical protein